VSLYRFDRTDHDIVAPTLIAAFDGWVDAGAAATTAAERLADEGSVVATFDADRLFDYRARRPTLEVVDGRLDELTWPELTLRHARIDERDLLVLAGAEPDFRWHEFAAAVVELIGRLGVVEWISLGAIPAAVPHTRSVPILGTASQPGLLRAGVRPGPAGTLRVPAAALSILEMAVAAAGHPAVGYFSQIPHYVSGPYPLAAIELLRTVGAHLEVTPPLGDLESEADQLRKRLDTAAAIDEATRQYVERLEGMVDEQRLPSGDELIADIEKYLRDQGAEGSQRS
jgi:hypothetical protein